MDKQINSVSFYKIINEDGLFSTGGAVPTFHKNGKTWGTMKAIKQHMAAPYYNFGSASKAKNKYDFYKNCSIVEYTTSGNIVMHIKDMSKKD